MDLSGKKLKPGQLFTLNNMVFQVRRRKPNEPRICEKCDARIKIRYRIGSTMKIIHNCMENLPPCGFSYYFKRIK